MYIYIYIKANRITSQKLASANAKKNFEKINKNKKFSFVICPIDARAEVF